MCLLHRNPFVSTTDHLKVAKYTGCIKCSIKHIRDNIRNKSVHQESFSLEHLPFKPTPSVGWHYFFYPRALNTFSETILL